MLHLNQKKGFSIQRMSKVKTLQNLEGKIFLDLLFFFFTKNMKNIYQNTNFACLNLKIKVERLS